MRSAVLLVGAGAGLVFAVPHPQFWGQRSGSHKGHKHSNGIASYAPQSYTPQASDSATTFLSYPSVTISNSASAFSPTSQSIDSSSYVVAPAETSSAASAPAYSAPPAQSSDLVSPVTTSGVSSQVSYSSATAPSEAVSSGSSDISTASASSGCTFTDSKSAVSGKKSCASIVLDGITVPAGETLDLTDLQDGTTVQFQGTTTFEYSEWEGPLVSFSGKSITITGASGHVIDANGQQWWDGKGSNGGKTKPKFFYAHDLTDSTIKGLNVKNTPVQGFSVNGAENLSIEDMTIDNTAGDTEDGGHNTDCFDVGSSTGVYFSGITCKNQDDCLAINSGTDIHFTGGTCSGGHGLSIGSVGGRSDNDVKDISITDCSISSSDNGVRIKAVSGATGSVQNVTYSGIKLSDIAKYGIVIEQDYENGSPTGTPTDGVPITGLTLSDITGSVSSDAQASYVLCAACKDWTVSGVDIAGGSKSKSCEGEPSGASLC